VLVSYLGNHLCLLVIRLDFVLPNEYSAYRISQASGPHKRARSGKQILDAKGVAEAPALIMQPVEAIN
jgi:hypothetical protein